jgi:hypothetical protein
MFDATMWKLDGAGQKVVRSDGMIREVIQMTFYRHRVTNQLKIFHQVVVLTACRALEKRRALLDAIPGPDQQMDNHASTHTTQHYTRYSAAAHFE